MKHQRKKGSISSYYIRSCIKANIILPSYFSTLQKKYNHAKWSMCKNKYYNILLILVSGPISFNNSRIAKAGAMVGQYNQLGTTFSAISFARTNKSSTGTTSSREGALPRFSSHESGEQNRPLGSIRRGMGGNSGEESATIEHHKPVHNAKRDPSIPGAIVAPGVCQ